MSLVVGLFLSKLLPIFVYPLGLAIVLGLFALVRLKRIGRAARLELNHLFGRRYHLTLWVKVRENWADDARALRQLELE